MSKFEYYYAHVNEQAVDFVERYFSEAKEYVKNDGDLESFVMNDGKLHNWADTDFFDVNLADSADILEQSARVETDSGLWDGQQPMEAVKTQAFFTYRNDLYDEVKDEFEKKFEIESNRFETEIVDPIREKIDKLKDRLGRYNEEEDERVQGEIDALEEVLSEREEELEDYQTAYLTM